MIIDYINNIEITTNNNDIIKISKENIEKLYICNLDENAEEIDYKNINNKLYANFFLLKIVKDNKNINNLVSLERLNKKKDIIGININFINGVTKYFNLAKKRISINGLLENKYEYIYDLDKYTGIVISEYNLKYKQNLFE